MRQEVFEIVQKMDKDNIRTPVSYTHLGYFFSTDNT